MSWWTVRGHDREVSRSMVALVVSLSGLLALGGLQHLPRWLEVDTGVVSVEPSLLTVDPSIRGMVTLGEGYTVGLSASGIRFAQQDTVLADTVTRGAPVVAVIGRLRPGDPPREDVTRVLSEVRLSSLQIGPGTATYTGTVSGSLDGRVTVLPLYWQVVRSGNVLHSTITVPGADALVISLDHQPNIVGTPPALPARNLRLSAWWLALDAPETSTFTWFMPSVIGVGPQGSARAVDDDVDGRVDLHVWGDRATLLVTEVPMPTAEARAPAGGSAAAD